MGESFPLPSPELIVLGPQRPTMPNAATRIVAGISHLLRGAAGTTLYYAGHPDELIGNASSLWNNTRFDSQFYDQLAYDTGYGISGGGMMAAPMFTGSLGTIGRLGMGEVGYAAKGTTGLRTGTVWDSIQRVDAYGNYPGTILPRGYIATIEGKQLFVPPNATKHILEGLTGNVPSRYIDVGGSVKTWQSPITGDGFRQLADPLRTQMSLKSMHSGVADIIRNNKVEFGKRYVSQDNWEIIFSPPRKVGELPAIKHARQLGE